jgi:hypothetical protein
MHRGGSQSETEAGLSQQGTVKSAVTISNVAEAKRLRAPALVVRDLEEYE